MNNPPPKSIRHKVNAVNRTANAKDCVEQFTVKISGRDYRLSCAAEEKQALLETVAYVDAKMTAIRDSKKLGSHDRIAVFTALHIASELLKMRSSKNLHNSSTSFAFEEFGDRIKNINAVIDAALEPQEKLFE